MAELLPADLAMAELLPADLANPISGTWFP